MARKRASLQGRGNEILMGANQDVQVGTVDGLETQSDIQIADSQVSSEHEQGPERDATDLVVEPHDLDDDGAELASELEGVLQGEASSASGDESSVLNGDTTAGIASSFSPLGTTPARPKRPADQTLSQLDGSHSESPGTAPVAGAQMPASEGTPEATDAKTDGLHHQQAAGMPSDEDEIVQAVSKERSALWRKTLKLYEEVPDILSGYPEQERALGLLQEAQGILLATTPQLDVAKFKVGKVQALVSWRRNVNRWSNTWGWGVFVYEILWLVLFLIGVFAAKGVANLITGTAGGALGIDAPSRLWSTMMWGGLGGVIGAFYTLYWHVADVRDFHKQYVIWYVVQPPIGVLLGALVFLLIGAGLFTGQGTNPAQPTGAVSLFPYVVACIAGFRQRFILEMIDRVIQVITPSSESQQNADATEETSAEQPPEASD